MSFLIDWLHPLKPIYIPLRSTSHRLQTLWINNISRNRVWKCLYWCQLNYCILWIKTLLPHCGRKIRSDPQRSQKETSCWFAEGPKELCFHSNYKCFLRVLSHSSLASWLSHICSHTPRYQDAVPQALEWKDTAFRQTGIILVLLLTNVRATNDLTAWQSQSLTLSKAGCLQQRQWTSSIGKLVKSATEVGWSTEMTEGFSHRGQGIWKSTPHRLNNKNKIKSLAQKKTWKTKFQIALSRKAGFGLLGYFQFMYLL